jgi:hypothetical protein
VLLAYLLDVYFVAGRQEGKKGDRLQDGKGMMLEFAFSRGMEELCHPRRQGDITIARKRENLRIAVLCVVYVVVRRKHGGRHTIMFWHLLLFILLLSSLSACRNQ